MPSYLYIFSYLSYSHIITSHYLTDYSSNVLALYVKYESNKAYIKVQVSRTGFVRVFSLQNVIQLYSWHNCCLRLSW